MKDREMRITEIAKDMCFHADSCIVGAKDRCYEQNCETTWLAEKLVNANYQKVDENSVVLTKDEYLKLSYGANRYIEIMRDRYEYSIQKREAMAILDEYHKALADIEAKTIRPIIISNDLEIKEN